MTPKIVDKHEKRTHIISAAIRVFAKLGFARTKMIQISEAAGIGKGTIYEYFKNKEELVSAVFKTFVQETENQIDKRVLKVKDPVAKLKTYFSSWLEILDDDFIEYGDLMIDIWAESVRLHEGKDIFDLKGMYAKLRTQLIAILDEGIKQTKMKPMNTTLVSSVILATMDGLFLQYLLDKKSFDIHEAVKEMSDILVEGILIE